MNVPLVLSHFLDRAALLYGDKKAIIGDDKVLTYLELNGRVNQLSNGLRDIGVKKGDKVAYLDLTQLKCLKAFMGYFNLGQ